MLKWVAFLSNGDVIEQQDNLKQISNTALPWSMLKERCDRDGFFLNALSLEMGKEYITLPLKQQGYWHAYRAVAKAFAVGSTTSALGIGWVENDQIHILWAKEVNGQLKTEMGLRDIKGEPQIIWAPPFRRLHGGGNERILVQDGKRLIEGTGDPVSAIKLGVHPRMVN